MYTLHCNDYFKPFSYVCIKLVFVLFRDVTGAALRELVNQGKVGKLQKFEIPGAVSA